MFTLWAASRWPNAVSPRRRARDRAAELEDDDVRARRGDRARPARRACRSRVGRAAAAPRTSSSSASRAGRRGRTAPGARRTGAARSRRPAAGRSRAAAAAAPRRARARRPSRRAIATTGRPCSSRRQQRQRRRRAQVDDRRQLVGRLGDEVAVEAQHLGRVLERVVDRAGQHGRADRVQPVLERRDDAEVAAAAAQAPEQLGRSCSLAETRSPSAVTTSAASRLSTVAPCLRISQPMPPPSVSPAMPVWVTMPPAVASPCACVAASSSPHRTPPPARAVRAAGSTAIALHRRQVDHQAAVAHGLPGDAVAAAAHRDRQVALARESQRRRDVVGARAAGDQRRAAVDRAVPDPPRLVVAGVVRGRISSPPTRRQRRSRRDGKSTKWTSRGAGGGRLAPWRCARYGQYCPIARATRDPRRCAGRRSSCATCCSAARRSARSSEGAPGHPAHAAEPAPAACSSATGSSSGPNRGRGSRYRLTAAGPRARGRGRRARHLGRALARVAPEHLDAALVLWSLCRAGRARRLPGRRLVIRFDLRDGPRRRFWVVLEPPDSEVCVKPPGYDEDLVVATELGVAREVAHGPDLARPGDARGADVGRGPEPPRPRAGHGSGSAASPASSPRRASPAEVDDCPAHPQSPPDYDGGACGSVFHQWAFGRSAGSSARTRSTSSATASGSSRLPCSSTTAPRRSRRRQRSSSPRSSCRR